MVKSLVSKRLKIIYCMSICVIFICILWNLVPEIKTEVTSMGNMDNSNMSIADDKQRITTDAPKLYLDGSRTLEQYDLRIIAMVFDRAHSLLRLLNSLNAAQYFNDRIKLEVWMDRAKNGSVIEKIQKTAMDFKFLHGEYSVHAHATHVGIYGQWLNAWSPVENSSEIAVILEDDLTVSPLFYRYLKAVHKKYDHYPYINGFALQGFSVVLSHNGGKADLKAPYKYQVFLYPILGCWGFSPSAKNWASFLKWVKPTLKNKTIEPVVPHTITSVWYRRFKKEGRADSMWSIWHIYYAYKHNERTLYSNLKDHEGFTANWREVGLHYGKNKDSGTPSCPLVQTWKPVFDNLPDNPVELNMNSTVKKTS